VRFFPHFSPPSTEKVSPMTETTPISATPLAVLLAEHTAPPELAPYRGVLTPRQLDAPQREIAALTAAAAVHDLGWLSRVAVRGEDRFRWLSGMVTNIVNELPGNGLAWNLVLNAQGRILGDLHVSRDSDQLELVLAVDQAARLLTHFERFIIMDDVELVPLPALAALGLSGPRAADLLAGLGLPTPAEPMTSAHALWRGFQVRVARNYGVLAPHFEIWIEASEIPSLWRVFTEAGAIPAGVTALEALRIAEAIPLYGQDIAERDLPQETSQMRTLNFSKGCYQGQEIVERIRSRGSVHRHLRSLELLGPLPSPGDALTLEAGDAQDAAAGLITSAAALPLGSGQRAFALAMMRGDAELRGQSFSYTVGAVVGTARILSTPPHLELGELS